VGHGGRYLPPYNLAVDVYFSKILVRPFIFRKSKKKKYKKINKLSPNMGSGPRPRRIRTGREEGVGFFSLTVRSCDRSTGFTVAWVFPSRRAEEIFSAAPSPTLPAPAPTAGGGPPLYRLRHPLPLRCARSLSARPCRRSPSTAAKRLEPMATTGSSGSIALIDAAEPTFDLFDLFPSNVHEPSKM
jgi:hypothetical protein